MKVFLLGTAATEKDGSEHASGVVFAAELSATRMPHI
jgi:hypothetical protein